MHDDSGSAHGIMLHHFHGSGHPEVQGSITGDELSALIRFLGEDRFLTAQEWVARAENGSLEPQHLCLTFDDALLCQFDVARTVIERHGLTGFWFVYSSVFNGDVEMLEIHRYFRTTQFDSVDAFYDTFFNAIRSSDEAEYHAAIGRYDPETFLPAAAYPIYTPQDRLFRYFRDAVLGSDRYNAVMDGMMENAGVDISALPGRLWMTDDHLATLHAGGQVVGMHSWSHPTRMANFDTEAQRDEYARNHRHLRAVLGEPPVAMSHPCNSYTPETLDILRDLGLKLGFRSNQEYSSPPSRFEFPRKDHANIINEMRSAGVL